MQPAVKRHTKQCTIQQQILNTCCTIQECLLQSCYNHDGSMTGANVYNGPCKQIEEKRRVNDNIMKDYPKSSLINLTSQQWLGKTRQKYILFCPIQKQSGFFFLIYKSLVHWSLVGKLCAVLLMSTGAQQEVSTSSGLSPNAEIMALPGFHEILHLLACPLTIIHILDDSIVPDRGG